MSRYDNLTAVMRPDLGGIVQEALDNAALNGFVGGEIMPEMPVGARSGSFTILPAQETMSRADLEGRAPRSSYPRITGKAERMIYLTTDYGAEEVIDDDEAAEFDTFNPGASEGIATSRVMNHILTSQEKRIIDIISDTNNFSLNAVSVAWDNASGVPLSDINTAKESFRQQAFGVFPNAFVINNKILGTIRNNAQVRDQLKYTMGKDIEVMDESDLSQLLGLRVLVSGAQYNTAGVNLDASSDDIMGDTAFLCRLSNSPDIRIPSVGRTFRWVGSSPSDVMVESYRDEKIRSWIYRVRHHVQSKMIFSQKEDGTVQTNISANLGYMMSGLLT